MGASLSKVVLGETWPNQRLSPSARVIFAFMAMTAIDSGEPPRYFAGRDPLVRVLDGYLSDPGPARNNQYARVKRLMKEIKNAGGIVPLIDHPHAGGRRQDWEIRVYARPVKGGYPATPSPDEEGFTDRPPMGAADVPPSSEVGGHFPTGKGGAERPPNEYEEQNKLLRLSGGSTNPVSEPTYVSNGSEVKSGFRTCTICGRSERLCRKAAAMSGDPHVFTGAA